jgi:uncharacterized protein (DUF302 family)
MNKSLALAGALFACSHLAAAADGVISVPSAHSVKDTADRLDAALQKKGMKVFLRVDHAAGAASVGKTLRPTELLVFGNPKVGAPLMLCAQSIGIDLPQKALISQDADGRVWFSYNDPDYLQQRHHIDGCDPVLAKLRGALENFAKAATSP